jgi:hypothetical protein
MGPGIGESIVLQLPCGGWGVVDCYDTPESGTLRFLRGKNVNDLKFFCLTHPHEDHYLGAYKLFEHYSGRIEYVWRPPGLSSKDFLNLALAAKVRAKYKGDPEANGMAEDYLMLLKALSKERKHLSDDNYRQIIAPVPLIQHEDYTITAIGPKTCTIEDFQKRFARIMVKDGPMLLAEEGGDMINSLSVVLAIKLGSATVYLLGDAQGPRIAFDTKASDYSVVKIAHHGSSNGLGAEVITYKVDGQPKVDHAIVTPYARSGLPTEHMSRIYRESCRTLVHTHPRLDEVPRRMIPGLNNARVLNKNVTWIGVEVTIDGLVRRFQ